jgi:hypothetical protein
VSVLPDIPAVVAAPVVPVPMLGTVELEYGRLVVSDVLGMGTAA